jgi:hypothetical protein
VDEEEENSFVEEIERMKKRMVMTVDTKSEK